MRRPRVLAERFESWVLRLFKRRTEDIGRLLPELYLHGLAEGDFDLALRGLLGEGAPLSASSVARLKTVWYAEYEVWRIRGIHAVVPLRAPSVGHPVHRDRAPAQPRARVPR